MNEGLFKLDWQVREGFLGVVMLQVRSLGEVREAAWLRGKSRWGRQEGEFQGAREDSRCDGSSWSCGVAEEYRRP